MPIFSTIRNEKRCNDQSYGRGYKDGSEVADVEETTDEDAWKEYEKVLDGAYPGSIPSLGYKHKGNADGDGHAVRTFLMEGSCLTQSFGSKLGRPRWC
jgi:hypothetical protein